MKTLEEKMTKKEQQELLLRETKKTLQKELAHFKGRKILTSEELIKIKEDYQWWWGEKLNMRKKLTPLEELQLISWMDKRRLVRPIVERMIFHYKPGPYDQSINELGCFDIDVRDLLLQIRNLKEERDNEINEITDLKATIEANEKIIKIQERNLDLQDEIIQRYKDCNTDQTDGPLRVVFNKNLN